MTELVEAYLGEERPYVLLRYVWRALVGEKTSVYGVVDSLEPVDNVWGLDMGI